MELLALYSMQELDQITKTRGGVIGEAARREVQRREKGLNRQGFANRKVEYSYQKTALVGADYIL